MHFRGRRTVWAPAAAIHSQVQKHKRSNAKMSVSAQSTVAAADIGLLSACAFLGTIGASLTGFGQAIIFLFVWQIVELAGYDGDFKSAVFIQALSLFSMQPLVLYKAKVWKNAHRRVLLLFVPITLVSTPLGQLVSDGVPTSIVQAVAGVLVTFVACWELYSKRNWFLSSLSLCNKKSKGKEDGQVGADDDTADHAAERGEAGVGKVGKESNEPKVEGNEEEIMSTNDGDVSPGPGDASNQIDSESELLGKAATTTTDNSELSLKELSSAAEAATPPKSQTTISSVYASLAVAAEPNSNVDMSSNNQLPIQGDEDEEQLKIGINKPTLLTLLAGGKFFYYSIDNSLPITYCVDTHDQPLSPSIYKVPADFWEVWWLYVALHSYSISYTLPIP